MSAEGGVTPSIVPNLPGVPEQTYLFPKSKGHSRSVSHGGTPTVVGSLSARAPLKSALRGHQRAFSQGQIEEGGGSASARPGHSRVGSRTDFILPPGHRDQPPTTATRTGSLRTHVHSRQGSRSESIYTLRHDDEVGTVRKLLFRMLRKPLPTVDNRNLIIVPNHLVPDKIPPKDHPNASRCNNYVRTTKYTLLSFIPKNLLEQFHRFANVYFIFIVLLNWVPSINAFGKEVAMLPVVFVLSVTAIKDLCEDRRRHKSDKRINNLYCKVYNKSANKYEKMKWKDVRVGDLVHLSNNEAVPADMVLLRCSNPFGTCYIETCNLDGETNLKQRMVAPGYESVMFTPALFRCTVEVERPSTKIYRFHGTLLQPEGARTPLTSENLLLRESTLKNTDYVEGIVVYAGHETKAMLNNGGPRYKCSRLEKRMNTDVIWCVLLLLFLCCAGAIGCKLWLEYFSAENVPPYLPYWQSPAKEGLLIFWTYIIVLQVMIPVSLYVALEVTKLLQVYHINQDEAMYDESTNSRVECRALNINEELGQVAYIFSDKTGTLTENKMVFKRCTVGGVDYEHGVGPPVDPNPLLPPLVTPVTHVSPNRRMLQHVEDPNDSAHSQKVREFLMVLCVCNTVMVSQPHVDRSGQEPAQPLGPLPPLVPLAAPAPTDHRDSNGVVPSDKYERLAESRSTTPSPQPTNSSPLRLMKLLKKDPPPGTETEAETSVHYEAESPDELALVEAALSYGYELRRRSPRLVELAERGTLRTIRVLRVQHFDANRKCMSIAVLTGNDDEVTLYVKGADSTILNALVPPKPGTTDNAAYERVVALLSEYSRAGLRTLVMAKRTMTMDVWNKWLAEHERAVDAIEGRDRLIRDSLEKLESQLTLIGASGVEDRLQENVPRTINSLRAAGIVIWVLTGDKPETAINIAYSAALFSQDDELLHLMARDRSDCESTLTQHLLRSDTIRSQSLGLVVDGRTLTYILVGKSKLMNPFLNLAKRCSSVLCCRATPLQKAYIVRAVKEELGVTTLAIGDGANDVSMIQTADVGIGLSGMEGRQAVMAADFVLPKFKYLERLLLVHGHWSYDRLARMILYFFLKNIMFVFVLFWYQLYCGFSAVVAIDQMHLMVYNLVFTAVPPLVIGAYDRCAPTSLLLEQPALYTEARRGIVYGPYTFLLTLLECIYVSVVIFFGTLYVFWGSDVDSGVFGVTLMTTCLTSMLMYAGIDTRSWTIIHVASLMFSLGSFYVLTFVFQSVCVTCLSPSTFHVLHNTLRQPFYWFTVALVSFVTTIPRVVFRGVAATVRPSLVTHARRRRRSRLPFAAHYHTPSCTAHVYRSTDEDGLTKSSAVTSIT